MVKDLHYVSTSITINKKLLRLLYYTTTKINVYDASFNVAFKTMSSFNYALMFNYIEFKVSLSCVIFTFL